MSERRGEFYSAQIDGYQSGIRQVDTFSRSGDRSSIKGGDFVVLYEGQPNECIGHSTQRQRSGHSQGSTYFDRLWRKGAGNHAEIEKRFIIVLCCSSKGERIENTSSEVTNAGSSTHNSKESFQDHRNNGDKEELPKTPATQKGNRKKKKSAKKKQRKG